MTPTQRTLAQTVVGIYWGYDSTPYLGAPPRLLNQMTMHMANGTVTGAVDLARLLALVNVAQADAAIAVWTAKYYYRFWRPVTAIREADPGTGPTGLGSGNRFLVGQGDPNWEPLGAPADNGGGTNFTPPFPAYTSGHATFGGAAFKIMEDFYHTDIIPGGLTFISDEFNTITVDQNGIQRPLRERTYNSFSQMAGENAQSRIYLGIHWQFDAIEGIRCGDGIADYIFTHALKPLTGGRPVAMPSLNPVLQIAIAVALEDVAAHGGLGGHDFFIAGETRSTAVPSPLSGPRSAKFSAPVNLVSREHDAEPTLGWLQSAHAHGANFADLFGDIFAFDYGW